MKYRQFLVKLGFFKSRSLIAFVVKDLTQKKNWKTTSSMRKTGMLCPLNQISTK
ncbi:hypothetical protein ACF3M2_19255 [Tissierella carlieri]|uniref:hypothetical protein n=1 Tax=Tissierella carlieri TaxID=689904 RepID=UPI003868EAC0